MLEKLFERPHALARHCNGPLCKERRRYLSHLARQQVPLETLRSTAWDLHTIAKCLRLASRPGEAITSTEVERQAALWVRRPGRPKPKTDDPRARFVRRATRWLCFMGRLEPGTAQPNPHRALITDTGLTYLKELIGLQKLKVFGTRVTDAGVQELRKANPSLVIVGH